MKSFIEFKKLWQEQTASTKPIKKLKHLVFIVMYPDDIKWNPIMEKQVQTTVVQTSGGITGSGSGHLQKLCFASELNDVLKGCVDQTHAMIVSVGMIFDMTAQTSPITSFYNFADSGEYCRAHIITDGPHSAHINQQHIELNLDTWRDIGCPSIWEVWRKFKRSKENIHDDYTPLWLKPFNRPMINNFSKEQRSAKAWSYPHLRRKKILQSKNWQKIKGLPDGWIESVNVDTVDNYTKILMKRMRPRFYSENTELIGKLPAQEFDLIFTPTAGYSGEIFADRLNFKGEVIFYDYCRENIEIKQNIVEMFMDTDQIEKYSKVSKHPIVFNRHGFLQNHYPDYDMKKFKKEYGDRTALRMLQYKMYNKHKIDYWVMDLIKTLKPKSYVNLVKKIKGKNVFFDASNIFSYHVSHAGYTLEELIQTLNDLKQLLSKHSKTFYIKGTNPGKQEIKNENICS
ncbi:MAG: hypothetical protein CBE47_03290 [Pelagibacteraceae bacterium TMED287]|nr:MAG: hypothetical protein CBE47_03290 [Pelagibacteraceae bacterium TMED287]